MAVRRVLTRCWGCGRDRMIPQGLNYCFPCWRALPPRLWLKDRIR